ncbi:nucleotidyltransferase family protein [Tropicimonas sp. TH_r6]|uniref:nucleotidyltransferase family protein n=1 Tax=Tropicimonas sp. TH_r6 TaxID=3082085 RepID=UPI0029532867|nr:nucleotidyltransferase family protein [Tropicimonas sp. TH_r6]MDV7141326.1 nucleotidyltransferase family protein [Tropicimonas sp. TH_r6]
MPADRRNKTEIDTVDHYLAALIRGDAPPLPAPDILPLLPDRALHHGVSALLLCRPAALSQLPDDTSRQIRSQALSFTAWEIHDRETLFCALHALANRGIAAVLLKGTALAYSCYGSPAERPRGDSDILVSEADWDAAKDALLDLGYHRDSEQGSNRILQEEFSIVTGAGTSHCVDLHRNLLPAFALSDIFSTQDLLAEAQPLPALGQHAFRLSFSDALLHACIHRAKHFTTPYFIDGQADFTADRLIWFYDMHLLADRLSDPDWARFETAAIACGGASLCRNGLERCEELLGTTLPTGLLDRLANAPETGTLSEHLERASVARRIWSDLLSVPEGQSRLAYLRQIFLPPGAQLRRAYPERANQSLARLHLHRYLQRLHYLRRERRQRRSER